MQEREIIQNPGLGMPRPGAANRAKVRMIIGAAPLNNAMFRVTTGLLICRSGSGVPSKNFRDRARSIQAATLSSFMYERGNAA